MYDKLLLNCWLTFSNEMTLISSVISKSVPITPRIVWLAYKTVAKYNIIAYYIVH